MATRYSNLFTVTIQQAPAEWTGTPSGTFNERTTGNTITDLNDLSSGNGRTFSVGSPIPSVLENVSITGDTLTFDTLNVVGNQTVDLPLITTNSTGSATVQAQITVTDTHALRGFLFSNKIWHYGGKVWGKVLSKS